MIKANASYLISNLGGGQHGHLGLVIPDAEYNRITGYTYTKPSHPEDLKIAENRYLIQLKVSRVTLLSYPNFNEPLEIHTDASKLQLGSVISQKGKPIAFYNRKLNATHINYTTTEHELLSIVETLKNLKMYYQGNKLKCIQNIKT